MRQYQDIVQSAQRKQKIDVLVGIGFLATAS